MEFLGDSILSFIVSEELYRRFGDRHEGELSRLRANLVNRAKLAQLSRGLQIGQFLSMSVGEIKSGGRERESILADVFEAIVSAVYLDSDYPTCKKCVLSWYGACFEEIAKQSLMDAKSTLQEWAQAQQLPLPSYKIIDIAGRAHEQEFKVECSLKGREAVTQGQGSTRRQAEQVAAEQYLQLLAKEKKS